MHRGIENAGLQAIHSDPSDARPKVDQAVLRDIGKRLLSAIGEDPERDGISGTPDRFARWWAEFIDFDPGSTDTTFPSIQSGQMVCVSRIRVWSLCEHHLLPFSCDISVGYLAKERVLGLSKIARIAHRAAHRLQVQERLVTQIGEDIRELAASEHVAVLAQGEHLCMIMRGVRTEGVMTSSFFSGRFQEPELRAEFLGLVQA